MSLAMLLTPLAATWENITVYHVNPHKYGAIPVNMDSETSGV